MKNINKKGFTLIELMAVVIVLIIVIFLALNKVNKSTKNAKLNTIKANAISYVKSVNEFLESDALSSTRFKVGKVKYDYLTSLGVNVQGTKPDDGTFLLDDYEVLYACLKYDKYYVSYFNGDAQTPTKNSCLDTDKEYTFSYTGREEQFLVKTPGIYKLEVWGAQGGITNHWRSLTGGYGGYSVGEVSLKKGEILYINVGESGKALYATNQYINGTYNGGGKGHTGTTNRATTSGGGATSIAFKSGLLLSLENDKDKVLMVAGGGGGTWTCGDTRWETASAGHGGGYIGGTATARSNSYSVNVTVAGPTQESGFAFGQGGVDNTNEHAGGGGGWYGGLVSSYASTGGSGYIGNSRLVNKHMAGYGVPTSDEESTKTISVDKVSSYAISDYAKTGDGFARITFEMPTIDEFTIAHKDYQFLNYVESTGTQFIDTGIIPTNTTGIYAKISSSNTATDLIYLGSYNTADNKYFIGNISNNLYVGYNQTDSYRAAITANKVNEVKLNYHGDRKIVINETELSSSIDTYNGQEFPMYLFALNNNGTASQKSSIKLYELVITNGSEEIAHYYPCYRKSDNKVGLYNIVNNQFISTTDGNELIRGSLY